LTAAGVNGLVAKEVARPELFGYFPAFDIRGQGSVAAVPEKTADVLSAKIQDAPSLRPDLHHPGLPAAGKKEAGAQGD
jgi:hypothetical protein